MKIVTYWDLESKNGLLPLMEQGFGWPFNEREFGRFIRIDPRLRNGSVSFCALEDERVVSYVGVMDLPTRTLSGKTECVGGIYGVATLPGYTRRGLSTALLEAAHEYFEGRGYRFSVLNTSPVLVAYSLYRKLGYTDVYNYPSAYKILKTAKTTQSKEKTPKPSLDRVLMIYGQYAKDKVGFVARDRAYMEMLAKDKKLTSSLCSERGYAIFKKEPYSTRILELVALSKEEIERLVRAVEQKARAVIFARAVLDRTLRQVYYSEGYTLLNDGHSVFMVKPLQTETSFKQVYGKEFFQTHLDHF
jgi:GNAT superfamily N-acetyltransferase